MFLQPRQYGSRMFQLWTTACGDVTAFHVVLVHGLERKVSREVELELSQTRIVSSFIASIVSAMERPETAEEVSGDVKDLSFHIFYTKDYYVDASLSVTDTEA